MAGLVFIPNPAASAQLARSPQMSQFLKKIADDAAVEVERRAPSIVKHRGSRIAGEVRQTVAGAEGIVLVDSPFWHFAEIGHSRYPARPYIRPGVQAVLSKYGGRWKSE